MASSEEGSVASCEGEPSEEEKDRDETIRNGPMPTSPRWDCSASNRPIKRHADLYEEPNYQPESRMREIRQSGSEGGGAVIPLSLPL